MPSVLKDDFLGGSPSPKGHVRSSDGIHRLHRRWTFTFFIFFSETKGTIGTKLGRNVHWMVPYKVYVCFCWSEIHKRNKRPNVVKKGVSIYMGINYLLFICFLWDFLNAFLKIILFRNMPLRYYVIITIFGIKRDQKRRIRIFELLIFIQV